MRPFVTMTFSDVTFKSLYDPATLKKNYMRNRLQIQDTCIAHGRIAFAFYCFCLSNCKTEVATSLIRYKM